MKHDPETGEVAKAGGPPPIGESKGRLKAISGIAAKMTMWRPSAEVLTKVKAVPTIFPSFDRATKVGGLPIERLTVLHGPSNQGKSAAALGFGYSFLQKGHFFAFMDAERTTPAGWLAKLMGDWVDHPGFVAIRPNDYEEAVDAVRQFCKEVAAARETKGLEDVTGLIVLDSLRKLVPKDFLKNIEKHGAGGAKGSIDGFRGRGGQLKAKLNADWMDEITTLLHKYKCAMVIISRESKDLDADRWDKLAERDFKVGGGSAVIYDASIVARVSRKGWIEQQESVVGERIKLRIWKTKVGGKDYKVTDSFLSLANGNSRAEGFWPAFDTLDLARKFGIVETKGSWLQWGEKHRCQGETKFLTFLDENPEALSELETAVRQFGDLE